MRFLFPVISAMMVRMSTKKTFILTLSCRDTKGIVAAVSGFLAENGGFIIESAQFGDASTKTFFMRTVFQADSGADDINVIKKGFSPVADAFNMDWDIYDMSVKPKILIMVSKQGHCLNDLLHRAADGTLAADVSAVISNHNDLADMVKWYKIPFFHLPVHTDTKTEQEEEVYARIQELNIDLLVLARYMQILSPYLVEKMAGRAINIHHSFLPSFKGAKPYHQAYDRGVKIAGATAHYVTSNLDEGPIIEQEIVRVSHAHSPAQMVAMGHDVERTVLHRAIKYHIERRVLINGNKTVVFY